MVIYIPTLLIFLASIAGLIARYSRWERLPKRAEAAAVGGYALGLLVIWLVACLLRGIFALSMADSAYWYSPITLLVPLFFTESVVIAIYLAWQFRQLGGIYEADIEWKRSRNDGMRLAIRYVLLTSLIAVPIGWMLAPGEYGVFKGSLADNLVPVSVQTAYEASRPTTDLEHLRSVQNSAVIPHAFAIAALIAPAFFYFRFIRGVVRRELDGNYAHPLVDRRPPPQESPILRIFNPRGGGRN